MTHHQAPAASAAPVPAAPEAAPVKLKTDSRGRLVPLHLIKPVDLMRDDLVRELCDAAREHSGALARFRQRVFADVAAFAHVSAEEYGVRRGGTKGNITLTSFDGRLRIVVSIAEHLAFDERMQAARVLIDECINDWSQGASEELCKLVSSAFSTDQQGRVQTARVLALRRLDIADPRWQQAMQAIAESVQVVGSKQYVRFYEKTAGTDAWRAIALDMATLDAANP